MATPCTSCLPVIVLTIALIGAFVGLLLAAAISDIRSMTIPNGVSIALAILYPAYVVVTGADWLGGLIAGEFVVERAVTARHTLDPVVKVEDDLAQRQLVAQLHPSAVVDHVALVTATLLAQREYRADILLWHVNRRENQRLFDLLDGVG